MGRAAPQQGGAKDRRLVGSAKPGADEASHGSAADAREAEKRSRANEDGDAEEGDGEGEGAGNATVDGPMREDADDLDRLDPSARHAAHLAVPGGYSMSPSAIDPAANASADAPVRARSLEELLPLLVRKIAWAGDRHKGTVRLELGAGAYAGAIVVVHAEGGRVRVEIGGNEGPELNRLRERLDTRLRGHGIDVESVT
jgi:hypothetical protein